jgi:hypothetical protein
MDDMAKKKSAFKSWTDPELAGQVVASLERWSRPDEQLTIGAPISLAQVREELVIMLASARAGANATDPATQAFSSGRASALTDALELLGKALEV